MVQIHGSGNENFLEFHPGRRFGQFMYLRSRIPALKTLLLSFTQVGFEQRNDW